MRRCLLGLSLLSVAACSGGGGGPGLDLPTSNATHRAAPQSIAVARGDVVIAGPAGYCVDKASSRTGLGTPFVVLASCSSVTGSAEAEQPGSPGLLTALVDQRLDVAPSPEDLRAFLQTEAGRASLARDGRASSVQILETNILKDALLLRIRDDSEGATPGLSRTYWRGLFTSNSRLVTVTATAFEARPIDASTLKGKLVAFITRIREATPTKDRGAARPGPAPLRGLLNRIQL